jgi:hypothetical protein
MQALENHRGWVKTGIVVGGAIGLFLCLFACTLAWTWSASPESIQDRIVLSEAASLCASQVIQCDVSFSPSFLVQRRLRRPSCAQQASSFLLQSTGQDGFAFVANKQRFLNQHLCAGCQVERLRTKGPSTVRRLFTLHHERKARASESCLLHTYTRMPANAY